MKLPKHVQLMERAFDDIVCHEDAWNQETWRTGSETSSCGTALCFAGWAAAAYGYRPLIADPVSYVNDHGGDYDDEEITLVSIPESKAPPNIYRVNPATFFDRDDPVGEKVVKSVPKGHVVTNIPSLADAILNVATRQNPDGTLNYSVFDSNNSLAEIRGYIDQARENDDLPPRDFTTHPVTVRIGKDIAEKYHARINRRAAAFNKRAVKGEIRTSDGR